MAPPLLLLLVLPPLGLLLLLVLPWLRKLVSGLVRSPSDSKPPRLPPGPWELPVIGGLHHLTATSALPHHTLRELSRRHGPVMLLNLGQIPTLVVSSAEAAEQVMKTHDMSFASRHQTATTRILSYKGLGILISGYGDYWRQVRKLCVLELFHTKRVHSFRPIREDENARLLRSISDAAASSSSSPGALVNLSERIHKLVNDTIMREIMGSRCKYQDEFLHELEEARKLTGGFNLVDLFPSSNLVRMLSTSVRVAERCHRSFSRIMHNIIHELDGVDVPEKDQKDLLSVLLALRDDHASQFPLTTDAITAITLDTFIAGSDTSSTTLEWAMSELMKNPRVLRKAQAEVREAFTGRRARLSEEDVGELSYLQLVLKETLRLHPPGPFLLPRECREPCRVMGYDVPKGANVLVNAWAIGRDAAYWEKADEFWPERFVEGSGSTVDFKGAHFQFIPFGAGRRMCPGMVLGLANIELALASLLYHFDWELPPGMAPQDLRMDETFGVTVRIKHELMLHPVLRLPYPAA